MAGTGGLLRLLIELSFAVCWLTVLAADEKWVWGNNNGRDGLRGEHSVARPLNVNSGSSENLPLFQSINNNRNVLRDDPGGPSGQLRYEVFENGNGPGPNDLPSRPPPRPPSQYPGRPNPGPQPPGRPITGFNPPPPLPPPGSGGQFNSRPRPPPPPPRPGGPGNPDLGVLTGPVPSWEKPLPPKNNDPTSFDTCKCVNSFNCKSPGLKFGNCDVGKVYCCYNNPGFGVYPSGATGAFGDKGEGPPILAGPNGPIDKLPPDFYDRPQRPPFPDGPPFNGPPPPGFGPFPFDEISPRNAQRGKSKAIKN